MAENTKIEWAHHTFNPWIGCTKVGPGCDNCYAEADFDKRRHVVQWGTNEPRKRTAPSTWAQPLRWNKMAEAEGTRHQVFCASLSDVFDNEVPVQWRIDLMDLILKTPHLDWLLLTKRIGNAADMLDAALDTATGGAFAWRAGGGHLRFKNVWIGATITSQAEADRDIPKLLAVPAAKRFLSMEPLLGPVDMKQWLPTGRLEKRAGTGEPFMAPHFFMTQCECCGWMGSSELAHLVSYGDDADTVCPSCDKRFACEEVAGIDWVIVGGESGPNARPMHPDWARSLRNQCQSAGGVPFLFKQWGEWLPPYAAGTPDQYLIQGGMSALPVTKCGNAMMTRIGKKAAGRMLDGREWNEVPAC